MTIGLFLLLLGVGIYFIVKRRAGRFLLTVGVLYFAFLAVVVLVDWSQAGWQQGYVTLSALSGWWLWFLEAFIFVGLGIWSFRREKRLKKEVGVK